MRGSINCMFFIAAFCFFIFAGIEIASAASPTITQYWNWETGDDSTSFTTEIGHLVVFKVTTDQEIDSWHWFIDGVETTEHISTPDNYTCYFTWRAGPKDKDYTISVYGENAYGNTQTITWNIQIPPLGYGNLSGKVTDKETSLAIEGVTMTLVGLEPSNEGTWNTTTDTNGNYSFTNLKKGSYLLTISKDGYNPKTKYIEVIDGQTITQDFQLVPYTEATITYDGEKIVISKGTANLTLINETLNDPSLLEQLSPKEWLLKVPIQIESTGILYITADDCEWLKMREMPEYDEVYIESSGTLDISNTRISGWNTTSNNTPEAVNRGYIIITPGGRLYIHNSTVEYIGHAGGFSLYGGIGCHDCYLEIVDSVINKVHSVDGFNMKNSIIMGNLFKHCKIKADQKNAYNNTITNNVVQDGSIWADYGAYNNTITSNLIYGKDTTAASIQVHGSHHNYVAYNIIHNTSAHGAIDVHSINDDYVCYSNIIEYNTIYDAGLGIYGSHAIYVHNNGAYNNTVNRNIMWNIQSNALDITMAHNNTISNNIIGENCGPLTVQSGHGNIVEDNKVHKIGVTAGGFGWDTYDNILISNDAQEYASGDLNGAFSNTIRNPKGGSFKVKITDANASFILEFTDGRTFKLNGDAGGHTNVTLTGPGTYTIDVEGVAATGNISGKVTDKDTGLPIEGASITANSHQTTTNSSGEYTISNLPVGNYTVKASKPGYLSQSKTVTILENQTLTLNFSLSGINLYLNIKTTKDTYGIGEVVTLTDPPEEERKEEASYLCNLFKLIFEGFLIWIGRW